MDRELFSDLPSDIVTDILLRLPIRTIIACKCVCRSWLNLLNHPDFASRHLSRSVEGLVIYQSRLESFNICELEEEPELHYNPVIIFECSKFIDNPSDAWIRIEGSVNGLLLLRSSTALTGDGSDPETLYICNPVTREYIEAPKPLEFTFGFSPAKYGFGFSRITGQYKVARIPFLEEAGYIYTLETGSWRAIERPGPPFNYCFGLGGAFLNGNLHWWVVGSNSSTFISCLDLETEEFTYFAAPPTDLSEIVLPQVLVTLEGCLCICDCRVGYKTDIWLMKEYGDERSWSKSYVINLIPGFVQDCLDCPRVIKILRDGGILMFYHASILVYSDNQYKIIENIVTSELELTDERMVGMPHMLSFLSLRNITAENVSLF